MLIMSNKQIYDPIHKFITFTPLMIKIIDTYEFQRLRDLKQLGASYFVFPSATHTRFEHSLGVSHLAGIMLEELRINQPELNITNRMIELVRIGALIHDLGHGPFSHLYDNYIKREDESEHELRGIMIFKLMVSKYNLELTDEEVDFICNIVEPNEFFKNDWLFQIVNNKVNYIDVDKIDYIMRDSYHIGLQYNDFSRLLTMIKVLQFEGNDVLAWNEKVQHDIYLLFSCRYRLHKQVYTHHTVKAYEFLLIPILKKINETIDFINFTDSMIFITNKNDLIKIYNRNIPKLIGEKIIIDNVDYVDNILENINKIISDENIDDFIIDKVKINLATNESKNPLSKVYYFNNKSDKAYNIYSEENSFIIPKVQSETIIRLYCKNNIKNIQNIENILELWNNTHF